MAKLQDIAQKIRSKNAGPFWLTVDIFCGGQVPYKQVCSNLRTDQVAKIFGIPADQIKRFEIPELNVVKLSLPRPTTQGARQDRDLHGASWASLIATLEI